MERTLKELTDIESVCGVYDIYKHCMYMPTKEKFVSKMTEYIADPGVKIYICLCSGEIKGVIAVSFSDSNQAEIFGIATDDDMRGRGVGSYMIKQVAALHSLASIYAETDRDAVGFYQKNGFNIVEEIRDFDGEKVIRYKCTLLI